MSEQGPTKDLSIHELRMKRYPSRWRAWLLRIALGQRTFDYMLRSIKSDKRTPAAKLVDIVIRQDAREQRIEADWVKRIAQITYHLPAPPIDRKSIWKRLWCALDDHGGIDNHGNCKRCGAIGVL